MQPTFHNVLSFVVRSFVGELKVSFQWYDMQCLHCAYPCKFPSFQENETIWYMVKRWLWIIFIECNVFMAMVFLSIFPPNYLISQKWWIFLENITFNIEKHVFPSIFSKIFFSKILQTLDGWLVFWWCIWSAFATIQCTHTLEPPTNGTHVKVSNQRLPSWYISLLIHVK
jgi:hypothetical protein